MEKEVIDRLIKWAKGKKAPPHKVLIYPTNRCNLKCPFCFLRLNPYDVSKDMPKEKWLEVTKELCEMGVDVLQISGGGEPLMVPETTLAMMKIIKDYEVTGRLVNNGTLWKEEYVKEVVEIGWDHVIFSVDGPDAKTQDKSRGVKGVFEKNVKAISTFKKYKKLLNSEKPLLEFSTVLTNINYKKLGKIIKLASKLGVENITFEPVFVTNPNVKKLKLNEKQREWLMKEIPKLKALATSLGVSTNLDSLVEIGEIEKTGELKEKIVGDIKVEKNKFLNLPCYEPWLWPKIEANGEVGPCSSIFLSNFYGKEINVKNKSFEEMWYGWEFENFRKMIMEGKLLDACSNCVSTHIPTNKAIREELRKVLS